MSIPSPPRASRGRTWIGASAVAAIIGVVTTLAVVWPGFDAQQTPVDDATVWALQTGAGSGYARVNLALGEIDTVKQLEQGSSLAQTSDRLFVFSDGGAQFADVDLATPPDLTADSADAFTSTPAGTAEIATAGDFLAFRTDAGAVFASSLSGGGAAIEVDPYADTEVAVGAERPRFVATAVAVDASGTLYAYSAAERVVVRADARTGAVLGQDETTAAPEDAQLSAVDGRWVLLDEATGELLVRGRSDPIRTEAAVGAVLQKSSTVGDTVYVADANGLIRAPLESGLATRVRSADGVAGTPVAPISQGDAVYAAWLPEGSGAGALWSSASDGQTPLDYGGVDIGDGVDPVFVTNGARVALNERRSGWVWSVPDGALVASSQQWNLDDPTQVEQDNELEAERVIDPKPPVAEPDAFGVRAGSVSVLPVLLNDHDPNEDVLSVDAGSLEPPDPGFGRVSLTGAEQQLVVAVAPDATGTATLSYRVTDGTTEGGLLSEPATVTLTVVPDDQNTAPVWCGVEGCLATWPSASVVPGGTVTTEVLGGWVDPEGDPIYLAGGVSDAGVGTLATSPDGSVTYQHPDPNAPDALTVGLRLAVSDSRGAVAERVLDVAVTPTPELRADSFAAIGVVGEPVPLPIGDHVSGALGAMALSGVVTLDEARSAVTTNTAALGAVFTATQPGSYLVQYTVRDDRAEVTATIRITMRGADDVAISTPPLTAFVRPNEDATVDVFSAVANPAGLVLLLSDIRPQSDPLAGMSVDLVGQSMMRVSGSTDSGEPGRLGVIRYTVSDGTARAGATASGELTVVLLPTPSADPPIAVDDAVTVRAGAQIDIPVLDNDSAPAGALIAVDPSTIVNESGGGLAFATSRVVRYFAPTTAGTYAVGYTIFRLGFPESTDTAHITITVVGDETNQAPVPRTLEGRVLSGESIRIPFDGFAVDPDGDTVNLDRILAQPEYGSATIAAEGDAILYTSPDAFSGQVRFRYQVRDAEGAVGSADVRVGVLDGQSDPSPVTYSDYLQIQVGEDSTAVVRPADNDIDPGGGELEVIDVVPNAPVGTAEYTALNAMLGELADSAVPLRAGTELGTFSFTYTVRNADGDTAMGLIVVKVVRGKVPDFPVVTDTTLTLETRETFPRGVDVLSDKVSWNTGDVSDLTLSLWQNEPGITVDGRRISGEVPTRTRLIPFEVTGTAFDGTEVTSYGFLRVLGDDDIRLALRAGAGDLDVRENASVDLDLAEAVAVPPGQSLVVDGAGVRAGGARAAATCILVSGTTIRYEAGAGAPWNDTCVVPVKVATQEEYTFLTLSIDVEAEVPQPTLRSASASVSPGTQTTYDLRQMVGWSGSEDPAALQFRAAYAGDQFTLAQAGPLVTVTARDAASPGREEAVVITLPSHPDTRAANLLLTVGPAPSALPKGGSAVQTCAQSGGAISCTIPVIGTGGEVNPLPGTPLRLVSASGPSNCTGVTFARASDTAVQATWSADAAGAAACTGSFVVADAQGRQSSGDRNGQVILDLQGLPASPTRVDWTAFTGTSVTLRPVSDTASYPSIDGYRISLNGSVVATCPASGDCPALTAPVGEKRTYQARAFNAIGESRSVVQTTAWAYRAPARPTGYTATPVPSAPDGGRADVVITGLDDTTGTVRLSGGAQGEATAANVGGTATFRSYDVGSNSPTTLTATPRTDFDLPPVPGGGNDGESLAVRANGIGAPQISVSVVPSEDGSGTVTATATVSANGLGDEIHVGFAIGASDGPSCTPRGDEVAAAGGTLTETFRRQPLWETAYVVVCAETSLGRDRFGAASATGSAVPKEPIAAPSGTATYRIGTDAAASSADGRYILSWEELDAPGLRSEAPLETRYSASGGAFTSDFSALFALGTPPGALVAASCSDQFSCGAATRDVTAADAGAQYTARVSFPDACQADGAAAGATEVAAASGDYVAPTATSRDADGVRTHEFTVTWVGRLASFGTVTHTLECAIPPSPELPSGAPDTSP